MTGVTGAWRALGPDMDRDVVAAIDARLAAVAGSTGVPASTTRPTGEKWWKRPRRPLVAPIIEHMFEVIGPRGAESPRISPPYPERMPLSAHAVAAELRARQPGLGTLKLHKLLYYCQGHHLATFGEPLFDQTVSAWDNGPVVGELWFAENRGLPPSEPAPLDEAGLNTIGYVMSRYGALSGRDLINLTHSEEPWRRADAEREPRTSRPIAREWMTEYFRADVGEDEDLVLDAVEVKEWLRDAETRRDVPGAPDDPDEIAHQLASLRSRAAR